MFWTGFAGGFLCEVVVGLIVSPVLIWLHQNAILVHEKLSTHIHIFLGEFIISLPNSFLLLVDPMNAINTALKKKKFSMGVLIGTFSHSTFSSAGAFREGFHLRSVVRLSALQFAWKLRVHCGKLGFLSACALTVTAWRQFMLICTQRS